MHVTAECNNDIHTDVSGTLSVKKPNFMHSPTHPIALASQANSALLQGLTTVESIATAGLKDQSSVPICTAIIADKPLTLNLAKIQNSNQTSPILNTKTVAVAGIQVPNTSVTNLEDTPDEDPTVLTVNIVAEHVTTNSSELWPQAQNEVEGCTGEEQVVANFGVTQTKPTSTASDMAMKDMPALTAIHDESPRKVVQAIANTPDVDCQTPDNLNGKPFPIIMITRYQKIKNSSHN